MGGGELGGWVVVGWLCWPHLGPPVDLAGDRPALGGRGGGLLIVSWVVDSWLGG